MDKLEKTKKEKPRKDWIESIQSEIAKNGIEKLDKDWLEANLISVKE